MPPEFSKINKPQLVSFLEDGIESSTSSSSSTSSTSSSVSSGSRGSPSKNTRVSPMNKPPLVPRTRKLNRKRRSHSPPDEPSNSNSCDSVSSDSSSERDEEGGKELSDEFLIMELKRKMLTLLVEIKSLEAQVPLLDDCIPLQKKRELLLLQKEIEDLENHQKQDPLDRKRKRLATELEITGYETQLPHLKNLLTLHKQRDKMQLEHDIQHFEHRQKRHKLTDKLEEIHLKMAIKEAQCQWRDWVENEAEYMLDPVVRNDVTGEVEIVVSDRIISLSGAITYSTSEYVTERIHYYNNKDQTYPIFLIIDYSPGGSVMSGYRILKAIESSPAPVYVIVKSFAASMAATIATLAKHSYAYPNAIILHHQIWSQSGGNLQQTREHMNSLTEWWRRLAGPLVEKLGISLEDWVKQMYEANSDGDWSEFGDTASKLRWVNSVVHRIRQTGQHRHPDWIQRQIFHLPHRKLEINPTLVPNKESSGVYDGKSTMEDPNNNLLPKLLPMDYYWIYNPKGYYSIDKLSGSK